MKRATVLALLLATGTAWPGAVTAAQEPAAKSAPPAPGVSTDPTQVRPGRYLLDPDHAKITWSISHLGFSTYYGAFSDVSGEASLDPKDPAKSTLSVRIGMGSVGTLNAHLDEHLKKPEFLDVEAFPEARFVARAVEPTGPTTARVIGDLTLKGVTKPVSFDATFNQAGAHPVDKKYTVGFDGRAVIKRSDFGVSAYLPVLGDEVALRLEGEFKAAE